MSAFDRCFIAIAIWVSHVEWGVAEDMPWPRWLYTLTDPLDRWFGDDKIGHWFGAGFTKCKSMDLLLNRLHCSPSVAAIASWFGVVVVILLVELVEVERWQKWQGKGAPSPWPWMNDKVSLKDIAWGLLGAWMATL